MKCLHECDLKTLEGYCQVTACINPEHNGSGTYIINDIKYDSSNNIIYDAKSFTNKETIDDWYTSDAFFHHHKISVILKLER